MDVQRRWKLTRVTILLGGVALGAVLVFGPFGATRSGGQAMNESRFTVHHIRWTTDKPFEEVAQGIERQLGRFDPQVYASLATGDDPETAHAKIAALAGPSGFMLFQTSNHGALLRLAGQKRKAVQYILGNPLIAVQMTRYDIRAGLYAPLRLLLYEDEAGKTTLEYDRPSSLFGQFGNAQVTEVAATLDQKMERLVAEAIRFAS
jgi:uncharacterized protein (DUF302 family)